AVDRLVRRGLSLPEPDRAPRPPEVPDRLAALPLDLGHAVPAERREQIPVEGQAALDRRHDQVDVKYAAGAHARRRSCSAQRPPFLRSYNSPPCSSSTTTWSRAGSATSRRATSGGSGSGSSRATDGS